MNLGEIAKAWFISLNPNEDETKLAQQRLEICIDCDSLKFSKIFNCHVCGECNCPIEKKVFSPLINPCPLKKWNK